MAAISSDPTNLTLILLIISKMCISEIHSIDCFTENQYKYDIYTES